MVGLNCLVNALLGHTNTVTYVYKFRLLPSLPVKRIYVIIMLCVLLCQPYLQHHQDEGHEDSNHN